MNTKESLPNAFLAFYSEIPKNKLIDIVTSIIMNRWNINEHDNWTLELFHITEFKKYSKPEEAYSILQTYYETESVPKSEILFSHSLARKLLREDKYAKRMLRKIKNIGLNYILHETDNILLPHITLNIQNKDVMKTLEDIAKELSNINIIINDNLEPNQMLAYIINGRVRYKNIS